MVVLIMSVTGGVDWEGPYNIILEVGRGYAVLFVVFVIFFTIAFMNIATSLFVEKALRMAKPDMQQALLEMREQDTEAAEELRRLIEKADADLSGEITRQEWENMMENPDFIKFFQMCNLDIRDSATFFDALVEAGRSPSINISDFVDGCMKMKGDASSIDMQILMNEVRVLRKAIENGGNSAARRSIYQCIDAKE